MEVEAKELYSVVVRFTLPAYAMRQAHHEVESILTGDGWVKVADTSDPLRRFATHEAGFCVLSIKPLENQND